MFQFTSHFQKFTPRPHTTLATVLIFLSFLLLGCGNDDAYEATFDSAENWVIAENDTHQASVDDGVYKFIAERQSGIAWVRGGELFADGEFSVEARQVSGSSAYAGFGLMIRYDNSGAFYLLEISSDGSAYIGRCANNSCTGANGTTLVGDWWFPEKAIASGLGQWNTLKIRANHGNLQFFVNDIEIGAVSDYLIREGDIALFIENDSTEKMEVEFDNFIVAPLE